MFAASVPEVASTLTDCCAIPAVLEADKVKVAGELGVMESVVGETVTPPGNEAAVTETDPVKPFCAAAETCTDWLAPPWARATLAGESEIVKLGLGGGGVELEELSELPPPQPTSIKQRRLMQRRQMCLSFCAIPLPLRSNTA